MTTSQLSDAAIQNLLKLFLRFLYLFKISCSKTTTLLKAVEKVMCWWNVNLVCSEKEEYLDDVAAAKLDNITVEMQWTGQTGPAWPPRPLGSSDDPVKRIIDGFKYFKTNYFE